jgi:hypothetical protein
MIRQYILQAKRYLYILTGAAWELNRWSRESRIWIKLSIFVGVFGVIDVKNGNNNFYRFML